jgi:hypothetical protein
MKNNNKYFVEAQHLSNERFAGVDGFDNFAGAYSQATGAESQGVNMHQYNAVTSAPYEFTVTNANTAATEVKMFDSYNARTAANFDNVAGITIASAVPDVTYAALLAQTEHKNFECGMTYIQVVSGSNAALTATWALTTKDANGSANVATKTPKKDPRQQQSDVLEFYNTFKINGYTKIVLTLPASTAVTYSFYPSATVDSGRALGNVQSLIDYKAPMISLPQTIQVAPGTAAALRG